MSEYGINGEYARNLYTNAMGIVRNADGSNVYPEDQYGAGIPVADVARMFGEHEHVTTENVNIFPGEADGMNDDGTVHYGPDVIVPTGYRGWNRKSDRVEHARFGAESADTRRQSLWLLTDYASALVADMHITAAGHTRNGARVYLQVATDEVVAPHGYEMRPFLTCFMSHDGSLPIGAATGMSVITCANQLAGIAASAVKSKQTSRVTDAQILDRARIGLMLADQTEHAVRHVVQLGETTFTPQHWTTLLDTLCPMTDDMTRNAITRSDNMRQALTGLWNGDARCAEWNGTALGAFQTLNTFDLWNRGTRGNTDRHERVTDEFLSGDLAKREESRLDSIMRVLTAA